MHNKRSNLQNKLQSVRSRISFLPKSDVLIQCFNAHLSQMLQVLDGYQTEEYLRHAGASVVSFAEETLFCQSLLEMLKDEPDSDSLRIFISNLINEISLSDGKHFSQHIPEASWRARVIAFYLPQFHPIPENDRWWGKGFTEWTNTGKAKPFFRGHYQPHVPADLGYYDLRVPEVRQAQADLAKQYGIEAFCYWHYWFAGHRVLERPLNEVLQSGQPDFPFCMAWANETWTGIWHGAPDRILIEQTYPGLEDYQAHFEALLPAFRDRRYLKVNGKLLFLIYVPADIPDAWQFTQFWQELAHKAGLPAFHFVSVGVRNPEYFGCQSCVADSPFVEINAPAIEVEASSGVKQPIVHNYADLVSHLSNLCLAPNEYPLVIPNWDNTPRSGENGLVLHESSPELFRQMMSDAVSAVEKHPDYEQRIIFVKSWNEWAEGNHLEPDLRYGHAYLEALRDAIS